MQTVADRLRSDTSSNHLLAASFFFGRGKSGRDKAKYLVPTIAYQIAISIPSTRQVINKALIQDPIILSKSIDAQLRYLITNPLREVIHLLPSVPFHTPTVIIDGLDECEGHESQRLILRAISAAVFKEHIPLRFLIASRPEPQISETFRTQPLAQHYYPITLVDNYQTREELQQFLRSGFDEICQRRFDVMSTVELPWPSEGNLATLAYRASGQFLYASTVLRFVDSDMAHPRRQLALILQGESGNAFSNMDELYTQILESCPCQEILPGFLGSLLAKLALMHMHEEDIIYEDETVTLADHAAISGLHPDDISVILRWLPAIVKFKVEWLHLPNDWPLQSIIRLFSPPLYIHHQSFIEFLTDESRSGKFYVDLDAAYQEVRAHLDALLAENLSKGEQSLRIYSSTWQIIHDLLLNNLVVHGLEPSLGWPRLQKTLNNFKEGRIPPLSKPCPEFLDALHHVLRTLKESLDPEYHLSPVRLATIQEFTTILTAIFDQCFHVTISSTSMVWEIAGPSALSSFLRGTNDLHIYNDTYSMDYFPQLTGLAIATFLRILEENWNFFNITISSYPYPDNGDRDTLCISMHHHHHVFLKDEVRSRDLYVTYWNSAVHALKSRITYIKNLKSGKELDRLGILFLAFSRCGLDIRINQRGSAVGELIELLLHNNLFLPKNLMLDYHNQLRTYEFDAMRDSHVTMQWLIKQFHILNAVPNPNKTIATMIRRLRDIIDRYKEDAITLTFDCGRYCGWNHRKQFDVAEAIDYGYWQASSSSIRTFYSDILFLLNEGISAECHKSILNYYLFVLIPWLFVLMGGRNVSKPQRAPQEVDIAEFDDMLDNVQWEYHLSRVNGSKTIHDQLLTIHSIFAMEEYDVEAKTRALARLPTPLMRGGLAWFRAHYEENEAFETWCERVLTLRAEASPSTPFTISSESFRHDPPKCASISPSHDPTTTTVADISSSEIPKNIVPTVQPESDRTSSSDSHLSVTSKSSFSCNPPPSVVHDHGSGQVTTAIDPSHFPTQSGLRASEDWQVSSLTESGRKRRGTSGGETKATKKAKGWVITI